MKRALALWSLAGGLALGGCDSDEAGPCDAPFPGTWLAPSRILTIEPGAPMELRAAGEQPRTFGCKSSAGNVRVSGGNFEGCLSGAYTFVFEGSALEIGAIEDNCLDRAMLLAGRWRASHLAGVLEFRDEDPSLGELGGSAVYTEADVSGKVESYRLQFGSDDATPAERAPIATVPAGGGRIEIAIPDGTERPADASHLLLSAIQGGAELFGFTSIALRDAAGFAVLGDLTHELNFQAPGQAALASDGENYLVASCRADGANRGIVAALTSETSTIGAEITVADINLDDCNATVDVAYGDEQYLVVYRVPDRSSPSHFRVFGVRVGADGTRLDPAGGFPISEREIDGFLTNVASDGTGYFAVWTHNGHLLGAFIDRDGQITQRVTVAGGPGAQFPTDIAFDGTNYLVLWISVALGHPVEEGIFATRVAPDGTILDVSGSMIKQAARGSLAGRLTYGAGRYLVVWLENRIIKGRFAGLDGAPAGEELTIDDSFAEKPLVDVAFDGQSYLVVWNTDGSKASSGIYAAAVTHEGEVRTAADAFGLAALEPRNVDRLGHPLGSQIITVDEAAQRSSIFFFPAITGGGGRSFIIWNDVDAASGRKTVFGLALPQSRP